MKMIIIFASSHSIHKWIITTCLRFFLTHIHVHTIERRSFIESNSTTTSPLSPLYSNVVESVKEHLRAKRSIDDNETDKEKTAVTVETAVFVDETLYNIMQKTFPVNTEQEIVTYVLTIMNAVQLLFKQPSLGRTVDISVVLMDILKAQPRVSSTESIHVHCCFKHIISLFTKKIAP